MEKGPKNLSEKYFVLSIRGLGTMLTNILNVFIVIRPDWKGGIINMEQGKMKELKIVDLVFGEVEEAEVKVKFLYEQLVEAQMRVALFELKLADAHRIQIDHSTDVKKNVANKQQIAEEITTAKSNVRFLKDEFDEAHKKLEEILKAKGDKNA